MKLGIVGSGIIVQEFLTIAHHLKETELTAICYTERSRETGRELADKYHIKQEFTDYEEFLNSAADTIYVALPNHLHFSFAKKALDFHFPI